MDRSLRLLARSRFLSRAPASHPSPGPRPAGAAVLLLRPRNVVRMASRLPALRSRYWAACWNFAAGPGRLLRRGSAREGRQLLARALPGLPDPAPAALTASPLPAGAALGTVLGWTV
ncbi:hypothetical protein J1605_015664 [Eschrichtius robustus]|uniref:Uncharacterized protein n=1 Tax=Eschrichtius robustus TaxID=9764 RepID=A0AB34G9C1_ESCRO|nr:hypothetical protein J1605_015664 [Eschrichtius robustus]